MTTACVAKVFACVDIQYYQLYLFQRKVVITKPITKLIILSFVCSIFELDCPLQKLFPCCLYSGYIMGQLNASGFNTHGKTIAQGSLWMNVI